jgi:cell division protein FtsL
VAALLATLIIVALLLFQVWSRHRVLAMGYEISEKIAEQESLLETQRRLRIEMRVLTRSDRLEPIARKQLGLITPTPEQILLVPAVKDSKLAQQAENPSQAQTVAMGEMR